MTTQDFALSNIASLYKDTTVYLKDIIHTTILRHTMNIEIIGYERFYNNLSGDFSARHCSIDILYIQDVFSSCRSTK